MAEDPTPSPPAFSRRRRRRVVAALALTLGIAAWVGRNALAERAVNRIAISAGVNAHAEGVAIHVWPLGFDVDHVQWVSGDGLDTVDLHRVHVPAMARAEGGWRVSRMDVRRIAWNGRSATSHDGSEPAASSDLPTALQDALNDLPSLQSGPFHWDSLVWNLPGVGRLHLLDGGWSRLALGPGELEVDAAGWRRGELVAGRDTVTLEATRVAARWRQNEGRLTCERAELPGVRAEGEIVWPLGESHGALEVQWGQTLDWLAPFIDSPAFSLSSLDGSVTTAHWGGTAHAWQFDLTTDDWLSGGVRGTDSSWTTHGQVRVQPWMPSWAQNAETWHLSGEGTRSSSVPEDRPEVGRIEGRQSGAGTLRLAGDATHDVVLSSEGLRWNGNELDSFEGHVAFRVEAWPGWHDDGQGHTFLDVRGRRDSFDWQLEHASQLGNARGHGSWLNSQVSLDVFSEIVPPTESSPPWSGTTQGVVEWHRDVGNVSWTVQTWSPHWGETPLFNHGAIRGLNGTPTWEWDVRHEGLRAHIEGSRGVDEWVEGWNAFLQRTPGATLPSATARFHVDGPSPLLAWAVPELEFPTGCCADFAHFGNVVELAASAEAWVWKGQPFGPTHVDASGSPAELHANAWMERAFGAPEPWMPERVSLDVRADTAWVFDVAWSLPDAPPSTWSVEACPPTGTGNWTWRVHRGEVAMQNQTLVLDRTPVVWQPTPLRWLPNELALHGTRSSFTVRNSVNDAGEWAVAAQACVDAPANLFREVPPDLEVGALDVQVLLTSKGGWTGHLNASLSEATWMNVSASGIHASLHAAHDRVRASWGATVHDPARVRHAHVHGSGDVLRNDGTLDAMAVTVDGLPLSLLHAWVDSADAGLQGRLNAKVNLIGTLKSWTYAGEGNVRDVAVDVPALGTSFAAEGTFAIRPDEIVLQNAWLADALGVQVPLLGAAYHEQGTAWNLNLSASTRPHSLLVMDLPPSPQLPISGTLFADGDVDMTFWDNQVVVDGVFDVDDPTEFTMSLVSGSSSSWGDVVRFVSADSDEPVAPPRPPTGVRFVLDMDVQSGARVKLIADELTGSHIAGRTEGHLDFTLEDWDRMDLKGELTVVEGVYDFALGQLVKKKFVAQPGGVLRWDGDPYAGELDLDAIYQTRANVTPVLGSTGGSRQMESIDVVLHLRGPMLKPGISFDLEAPRADALTQGALASALMNEHEQTSQAIALLSLQEFMPRQANTLQLGASGLQENSVDLLASQLSGWLSRINDDLEIGISYDALQSNETTTASDQDALQLAMKATFLDDKLEVEGSFGSKDLTQASLTATHLQDLRLLYHLNDDHSLQFTGFSESQTSTTQTANSTTQGIGIRWHKAFSWPWRQRATEASSAE